MTDPGAVARGFAAVEDDDSSIEILVNNAGIAEGTRPVLFSESGPDDWQPTVDLNLYGSMNLIRNCLPGMIEHRFGRIIQISSGAGTTGLSIGVSAYGAAKAAAESLIRHVAVENGKHGITANALALGLMANVGGTVNEGVLRLLKGVPVGRLGEPEEVGLAAAWLASDGGGIRHGTGHPSERWFHFRALAAGPSGLRSSDGARTAAGDGYDGGIVHVVIDHPPTNLLTVPSSRVCAACSTTSKGTPRCGSWFSAAPTRISS